MKLEFRTKAAIPVTLGADCKANARPPCGWWSRLHYFSRFDALRAVFFWRVVARFGLFLRSVLAGSIIFRFGSVRLGSAGTVWFLIPSCHLTLAFGVGSSLTVTIVILLMRSMCVYIYIYLSLSIYIYIYMYVYIFMYIYIYMYTYIYIYIYTYTHTHTPCCERGVLHWCLTGSSFERFAEYGWKPHRSFVAQADLLQAALHRHRRKTQGVRFHRLRDFEQHYFDGTPGFSFWPPSIAIRGSYLSSSLPW